MGNAIKDAGGPGKFHHSREPTQIDRQFVIRMNRDTLYSLAVFDLNAGPVTITLPDAGKRFRSMQVINEDQYVVGNVEYDAGTYTYDKEGYFQKNDYNAYSLNNIIAKKNPDGTINVQYGGCDGKIPNCLPIMNGWNYTVRLYRPRAEILNGSWKFPEAQPVN
jgi:hypothetical protein